jgi:hypothetical protein
MKSARSSTVRLTLMIFVQLLTLAVLPSNSNSARACGPYCCGADCWDQFSTCVHSCEADFGFETPAYFDCVYNSCQFDADRCADTCCSTSC